MTKRLKVAVLFFGQPRNVQNRIASMSHKIWLRNHDVDYFGHCWFEEDSISYTGGLHVNKVNIPRSAPKILTRSYKGISLVVDRPKDFSSDSNIAEFYPIKENIKSRYQYLLPVYASQFYSIDKVINEFFFRKIHDYDFIVLSRYDNLILRLPSLSSLPKNKLVVSDSRSYFADLVFIGQSKHIKALNVYPNLKDVLNEEDDFAPEELKRAIFFKEFTSDDVMSVRMNVSIIRSSSIIRNIMLLGNHFISYAKYRLMRRGK